MKAHGYLLRGLLLIAVVALLGWLSADLLDRHWIDVHVRGQGITGEALFLAVSSLLISVGMSRQVIAFLAGYGFGLWGGLLLSMLATVLGSVLTFYVARLFLRDFLENRFGERIRRLNAFLRGHTFTATLVFRLLPVGSNWMVNLAAGASGVRGSLFFLGSALGFIPQMLIFALVGSGIQVGQFWQVAVAMAMFVLAALLGVYLYRRWRATGGGMPPADFLDDPGGFDLHEPR